MLIGLGAQKQRLVDQERELLCRSYAKLQEDIELANRSYGRRYDAIRSHIAAKMEKMDREVPA